jgi:hypothetical protein
MSRQIGSEQVDVPPKDAIVVKASLLVPIVLAPKA